jgi:hypothetical protein
MRAYAFTARNRRVLILLGVCYAILIGINIWVFCFHIDIPVQLYIILGRTGCFPNYGVGVMAVRIGVSVIKALSQVSANHSYSTRLYSSFTF